MKEKRKASPSELLFHAKMRASFEQADQNSRIELSENVARTRA